MIRRKSAGNLSNKAIVKGKDFHLIFIEGRINNGTGEFLQGAAKYSSACGEFLPCKMSPGEGGEVLPAQSRLEEIFAGKCPSTVDDFLERSIMVIDGAHGTSWQRDRALVIGDPRSVADGH